jgi:hypothetical protein
VWSGEIGVHHEVKARGTVFANHRGPASIWQAAFESTHETLLVKGKAMKMSLFIQRLPTQHAWF